MFSIVRNGTTVITMRETLLEAEALVRTLNRAACLIHCGTAAPAYSVQGSHRFVTDEYPIVSDTMDTVPAPPTL